MTGGIRFSWFALVGVAFFQKASFRINLRFYHFSLAESMPKYGSKNGQFSNVLVNDPAFLFSLLPFSPSPLSRFPMYLVNVRIDVIIVLPQAKLIDVQKLSLDVR